MPQTRHLSRRSILIALGGGTALAGLGFWGRSNLSDAASSSLDRTSPTQRRLGFLVQDGGAYEVALTAEQWQAQLTDNQFAVLRNHATERRFTSEYDGFYKDGTYHCQGCDLPVYHSDAKYDSGTGWPSWFAPINEDAIRVKADNSLFTERTEVHCRRCGGHFGHIFRDGPAPTGLRHCLNGTALKFVET